MPATSFQQHLATKEVEDALAKLHVEHIKLNDTHDSLRQEHSLTLAHISKLKAEKDSAVTQCAAAWAQVQGLKKAQDSCLELALQSSQHDIEQLQSQRSKLQARLEELTKQKLSSETALTNADKELGELMAAYASEEARLHRGFSRMHDVQLGLIEDVENHEVLEAEHENLLSKHGRLNSEHELLLVDHQQLTADHGELSHELQKLSTHNAELEQERQRVTGQHRQKQYELAVAQEQQRIMLIQIENRKQAYGNDLHRLQDEVLSLEDSLQASKQEYMSLKADSQKQLQQQLQAQLQEQMGQQSSASRMATSALVSKLERSDKNASDLQMHLSQAEDDLSQCQQQLRASETCCSELEYQLAQSRDSESAVQSELVQLQADLKKLHGLAAGNHLSQTDLFQIFAEPGLSGDSDRLDASSTADSTSSSATSDAGNTAADYLPATVHKSDIQSGCFTQTAPSRFAGAPAVATREAVGTPAGPAAPSAPQVDVAAVTTSKPGGSVSGTTREAAGKCTACWPACLHPESSCCIASDSITCRFLVVSLVLSILARCVFMVAQYALLVLCYFLNCLHAHC